MTTATSAPGSAFQDSSAYLLRSLPSAAGLQHSARHAPSYIRWFSDISIDDIATVGGKNASLGEMVRELGSQGVKVPNGFAVTADGYRHFMQSSSLALRVQENLAGVDARDIEALQRIGKQFRDAILATPMPQDLEDQILEAYSQLGDDSLNPPDVAVRSSATAEDLPDASFAGQQETYLNVRGAAALLEHCRRAFASLFTDRAISYRVDKGFDHSAVALSIGVQRMVRSDLGAAGVMFTIDTETGFRDLVLINASYGLGENVVLGRVNPDEYQVFKQTLKKGFPAILRKKIGSKETKLIYNTEDHHLVKNVPVPPEDRAACTLNDQEILQLSRWACVIEDHYTKRRGRPTPMDIEWAKDGVTGELFIVQARPETVQTRKDRNCIETFKLQERTQVVVTGRSVGQKIASGKVRILRGVDDLRDFKEGEILVADKTDPDWEPVMKKAAGIITNRGGRTCHAAIVSRELGVPAIVGTERATELLRDGQEVTLSCAEGSTGFVYEGVVKFEVTRTRLDHLERPRTKIMLNIGDPEEAFALSSLPNDGVGLARMEFIISSYINIHPLALINLEQLEDQEAKTEIEELTKGYSDKPQFFVDRLAEGVAALAAAFYPKPVILRLSDFKSNEYAGLLGGAEFEPKEDNPMIGFRGASRYYHPRYAAGFALEFAAVRKVREEMGLDNLKVMVPFCRTVEEGLRVQAEMEKNGLKRGAKGLEIYVMCEIPSNVILASEFADIFDGFSIGSNDLTQLILGVDRDSELVAPIFDERNAAVKSMVADVIRTCRQKGCKIGICGQAPSDYPEFARFLVNQEIDSISLNPDSVLHTTAAIAETEKELTHRSAGHTR